jgi:hypothetical protein
MKKPRSVPPRVEHGDDEPAVSLASTRVLPAPALPFRGSVAALFGFILAGVLFQVWLLNEFHIRILDFVGPEDLLLAGLRRPMLVAALAVGAIPPLLVWRFRIAYTRIPLVRSTTAGRRWVGFLLLAVYFAALIRVAALYEASRIKAGRAPEVELELASPFSMQSVRVRGSVIVATQELLFIAVPGEDEARVVPFATIRQLVGAKK